MSTTTADAARHRRVGSFGRFALHFFEMCVPMCIGWAVGDLVYFAVADPLGSSEPFRDWPELSLAIVTFNMTAPVAMVASEQTLDHVWTAVRDLPLPVEGLIWLLGFPFLVGLAIWQSSWDEAVRLAAIAVLAVAYTFMFMPRERKR
jgi:hypothetical protein